MEFAPQPLLRDSWEPSARRVILTAEQIATFRREGVLIVPGLVDEQTLEGWRSQFWAACGADPLDAGTWPGAFEDTALTVQAQASTNQPRDPLQPPLGRVSAVQDVVAQLGGAGFAEGQRPALTAAQKTERDVPLELPNEPVDHFLAHWPPEVLGRRATSNGRPPPLYKEPEDFHLQSAGHIDGGNGNKGGWCGGYMLAAITYLDDLAPVRPQPPPRRPASAPLADIPGCVQGGGGTNYWPGSMLPVHRWMLAHPEHFADGSFGNSWGVGEPAAAVKATDLSPYLRPDEPALPGVKEFTAAAGDGAPNPLPLGSSFCADIWLKASLLGSPLHARLHRTLRARDERSAGHLPQGALRALAPPGRRPVWRGLRRPATRGLVGAVGARCKALARALET